MLQFLLLSLKSFIAEKMHVAMQELFEKRERKKELKKGQVFEISKTLGTQMSTLKKKR
jgi:hypothetical protein